MWRVTQRWGKAHLSGPMGCSGLGLGSRRRNGYVLRGLSDHLAESGPWPCGCKKEGQQRCQVSDKIHHELTQLPQNKGFGVLKRKQPSREREKKKLNSATTDVSYYIGVCVFSRWWHYISVTGLLHEFPAGCTVVVVMRRTSWTRDETIWIKKRKKFVL